MEGIWMILRSSSNLSETSTIKRQQIPPAPAATAATTSTATPPRPYMSTKEILEEHFPECLPSHLRLMMKERNTTADDDDVGSTSLPERWLNWLNVTTTTNWKGDSTSTDFVRYVRSTVQPRYDHITCPVMKARYNCAKSPSSIATNQSQRRISTTNETTTTNATKLDASDYKFVWRKDIHESWCDLQNLTDFIHGPASVPQRSVLLQGNSYLRQIWEAMVCGFPSQITNLTLLSGGKATSLAYIASRSGKLLQRQELGTFLINQQNDYTTTTTTPSGCHAPNRNDRLFSYYHENVTIPPNNLDHCSDDMAMVEFGYGLRIFFLFHPSRFHIDALVEAHSKLDIPNLVDVMMWIDTMESVVGPNKTTVREGSIFSLDGLLLPSLKRVQEASIGYFFGADNPWIVHPPDDHPCLPGIPDDEVNILIYLLLLEEYDRETRKTVEGG